MSYDIRIESGDAAVATVGFHNEVCRLGHAENCEIRIATRAAHALTVYRRGSDVFLLNRSTTPVTIGRQRIVRGSTVPWTPNMDLCIDGFCLRLQHARERLGTSAGPPGGDDSGGQLVARFNDQGDPASEMRIPETASRMIIGLCLMTVCFLLWMMNSSDAVSSQMDGRLASLTAELLNLQSPEAGNVVARQEARWLSDLLARYQLSRMLRDTVTAELSRSEARDFCESLSKQPKLPERESKLFRELCIVLGHVR